MVIGNLLKHQLDYEVWLVKPSSLVTLQNASRIELTKEELTKLLSLETDPEITESRYLDIPMERVGGKLIVSISGMMIPEGSWIATYFGYIGMDGLANILNDAKEDSSIDHVILKWDCSGSTAIGIYEFASVINELKKSKRVTSYCVGMMCSGAYLSGSCADEIYSSSKINEVGSIGVLAAHTDFSRMYENAGIKVTYLTAGKYKALGNPHEPLTEEARNELMRTINITYDEFKTTVKLNRSLSDAELNSVVEGRVFAASEAVDNKLIDGITTIDEILSWEGVN